MILDLVIILIVLLFTFIGFKRGLVKTAITILSFFIALILSFMLYKTVGNVVIKNTEIDEKIESTITSKIDIEDLKEKYEILPDSLIKTGEETVNELAELLTYKIIYFVTFIVLFIALRIALLFAKFLADIITKIPVIKQLDKIRRNNSRVWKGFFSTYSAVCNHISCITNDRSKIY